VLKANQGRAATSANANCTWPFDAHSLVVLSTPQWPVVKLHLEKIADAVNAATPGSYAEIYIPFG
jgi:hypothetical protein